jgi:SAM-dependent methyltransferase
MAFPAAAGRVGMNRFIHGMVRAVSETFDLPGPVLEVGSFQVPGQEALADVRPLFPGREYIGLDMRPGPGVDLVADVERLPLPDASVGTVLALNTFEHVRRFWVALDEVRRVLRPDGALLLSCPFYFHVHHYPSDYWRFTPEALASLLEDYPGRLLGGPGPAKRPANVWALALRSRAVTEEEVTRYRGLMDRYARNPLPWTRWLRCAVGRALFGRVPFAPYLERDKWETECLNPACP